MYPNPPSDGRPSFDQWNAYPQAGGYAPPPPPRPRNLRPWLIAGAIAVVVIVVGTIAMTVTTGGDGPTTTTTSTFAKAPAVGECVAFGSLRSGTETTTVRSCAALEATLQVTEIFAPVDGKATGKCPTSEFSSTTPTYTSGAARRSTGDFVTCFQPNFQEGQCYLLDAKQDVDFSFENLRSITCERGSSRVLRRVDGDATDAACEGISGKYTIQNFTRPPRTFCYAENA